METFYINKLPQMSAFKNRYPNIVISTLFLDENYLILLIALISEQFIKISKRSENTHLLGMQFSHDLVTNLH